jgi:hypothetical protein
MRTIETIQPVPPSGHDWHLAMNRLPSTRALAGTTLDLRLEDGSALVLKLDADTVDWQLRDDGLLQDGSDGYDAVEMRPGIFFVDYVTADADMAVSLVVDTDRGRAVTVINRMIPQEDSLAVRQLVRSASVTGADAAYEPIEETRELIGKRLFCEYSPDCVLEHLYLNSRTFAWQHLNAPPDMAYEADRDNASMWKIAEQLYLLTTAGGAVELTLLMDLGQMRNVGRLFGRNPRGVLDERCGAKIVYLGQTTYPEGYEPA